MVAGESSVPARRLVAVALTEAESARAGSTLAELCGAAGETDLLVVRRDPAARSRPVGPTVAEDYACDDPADDPDDEPVTMPIGELPGGRIRLHRLGLRWTVQDGDEPDLVAALSELVGFDPDDDTFCVAPARTSPVADPEIEVVRRAVRRVARVYGLPVLPYRRATVAVGLGAAPVPRAGLPPV